MGGVMVSVLVPIGSNVSFQISLGIHKVS